MKVAIVIPTYNRVQMVAEAAASALLQSHPARVVVVDDGSTDGTAGILAERFGSEIEIVRQENLERGAARNAGAALVRDADLLCFLDADDALDPGHVKALVDAAEGHPTAPIVVTRAIATDAALSPLGLLVRQPAGLLSLRDFLEGRLVLPQGAVGIRADAFHRLRGFSERRDLAGSEDWLLVARLLACGHGAQVDAETVLIRKHPGNTMANARGMKKSMLLAHELLFGEYGEDVQNGAGGQGLPADMRSRSRAVLCVHAATAFYGAGQMTLARALLGEAITSHPVRALADHRVPWTWLRSWLGGKLTRRLRRWRGR